MRVRGLSHRLLNAVPVRVCVALAAASALVLAAAAPAFAGAWWRLSSRAAPTFLVHGEKATIVVAASNVGDAGVDATKTPVTIKDTLPPGLEATEIRGEPAFHKEVSHLMSCELATLTCTSKAETYPAFEQLDVIMTVNVKPGAALSGEQNQASVHGGEQEDQPGVAVPGASVSEPLIANDQPTPFGVEEGGYALAPEALGGTVDTRAGSHPFQLTTQLDLNQTLESNPKSGPTQAAPALPKDLGFNLPPGLIGDPRAVPSCPTVAFLAINETDTNSCQPQSAIGVVVVTLNEPNHFGDITRAVPLWNLEPASGEPARLGFEVLKVPVVLDTSVRTGGDYGVTVSVNNTPQAAQILGSEVTIWGDPSDPSHDASRGWACLLGGVYFNHEVPCEPPAHRAGTAFLTLPSSCTGQIASTVEGHSWPLKSLGSEPGQVFSLEGQATRYTFANGLQGCQQLPFSPAIDLESEAHAASTPTGLKVDVHLPQQSTLDANALAQADVRRSTVTLPEGVQLNPASANGLQACSEEQIGYEGPPAPDPLSQGAPQPLRFSTAPAECPDASKVGAVHVRTPLLEHELKGAVYLATPAPAGEGARNPFGSLLALYVVAEDPFSGIRVKLAGEVQLNGQTGQITSTFADTPQVPFEDFELEFFGGPRASVATPPVCGGYSTAATFTPWSGMAPVQVLSDPEQFEISAGAGGAPCSSTQSFTPALQAGSTALQAGAFTAFTLQITHPDGDQQLQGITLRLPTGDAAMLSSVTPCPEPQASTGQCGPESEIGQATASAGLGPDPYTETGRVYITGPYAGAPFGLSIVTPAVAGPFDLGLVVVRSTINVDPHTAAVTIASTLPTIVQGIGMPPSGVPLQLQQITVNVDRPGFEFNPTSCEPKRIEGTLNGAQGATQAISEPFQVANCQNLPFHPSFTAATKGHNSKANGAALTVKVGSTPGQANIGKAMVVLPSALPSRLTTIQKACVDHVFEVNPASCPEGSLVGSATVHTPVLRSALTGPAYLVSHGGAAFPDLEFVLQGEGITLILDGQTAIRKGVTSSTFNSVPDAPVSSFETVLPQGPHSALTTNLPPKANYSLCTTKLTMPTTLTGQNGAVITQQTKIAIEGCGGVKGITTKKLTRAQKLSKALKACRKKFKHSKQKRQKCERTARKHYGPLKKKHAAKKANLTGGGP